MVVASLMQSPWWLTAGWLMVHISWIGFVIGLFRRGRALAAKNSTRTSLLVCRCLLGGRELLSLPHPHLLAS
jgi:hypothetical protein